MLLAYYKAMTNKILCILLTFLFSCSTVPRSESIKQSEAFYEVGVSYMQEENFQDAFIQFQKAIQSNPDNVEALNALGLIYMKFEDFRKAEQSFLDALDVDEDFSEVFNNLGVIYSRQKKWDEAIRQFENALKNPMYRSPERAYNNLGSVYYRLKKYQLAIEQYKNAIRRAPLFYPAYYGLALSYNELERYGDAAQAIAQGMKYDPEIKGNKQRAGDIFNARMVMTIDDEERKDYQDLIEILNY